MLKVAVLAGGQSDEKAVSLHSGAAVTAALQTAGYQVGQFDPGGQDFNIDSLRDYDVVFIALHGAGGEDGAIQKELESRDICFVGSDSQSSALCFDKLRYWQVLDQNHILQPSTEFVDLDGFNKSDLSRRGFVLKPNDGGSSIDTLIVKDPAAISEPDLKAVFDRHHRMILQPLVEGLEITVAVLGDQALPVIEIIPPANASFDYENKYNGATREICPPQSLAETAQQEVKALALRIHGLTGCRDLSRTDMIVTDEGKVYVLETNTIPGLTNQSLLPKAALVDGYDMERLCALLVETAYKRKATA